MVPFVSEWLLTCDVSHAACNLRFGLLGKVAMLSWTPNGLPAECAHVRVHPVSIWHF